MHTIQLSNGKQFSANPDEPLTDAAARQGIVLPHSCRTGRCSTCKCRVLQGQTQPLMAETALTDVERVQGWILGCARAATTDLLLDAQDISDLQLPAAKTTACRVHSISKLSADVVKVQLRLPPTSPLEFLPGQYIEVIGPGGVRRAYSIACAAQADKSIELQIRRVAQGQLSQYWFEQAQPNDLLRLHGPLGTFFLRPQRADQDLICLATGTGIAPIKAMLETLATQALTERPRSIRLYWGGRIPEDLYWNPQSLDLPLHYTPVLSRADAAWPGARGHITEALMKDNPALEQTQVYACGSSAMIEATKDRLIQAGLPAQQFFSDAFVASSTT